MRRVEVLAVGKLRDAHLRELCDDYYRRCSGVFRVAEREARDAQHLATLIPRRSVLVVLDERGVQHASREFSSRLSGWLRQDASCVVFAIGGADGVGPALRERADVLLSLGKMTFAHQLVRPLLAEQLYRAASIIQGSPYHRD